MIIDCHCETLEGLAHASGVTADHVQRARTGLHVWRFHTGKICSHLSKSGQYNISNGFPFGS